MEQEAGVNMGRARVGVRVHGGAEGKRERGERARAHRGWAVRREWISNESEVKLDCALRLQRGDWLCSDEEKKQQPYKWEDA